MSDPRPNMPYEPPPIVKILLTVAALLLLAGNGWAQSPEWCGNGIDDPLATGGSANGTKGSCPSGYIDAEIGNGCDKLCSGVDQDGDGYTSDGTTGRSGTTLRDCDDADRRVIPNEYAPDSFSSPTGYKYCDGSTGSFGSVTLNATTPLCEATGTGKCYYVSASGSNSNNCESYSAPCLTLGKFGGGGGGSPPSSPITLAAGDVVYILGSSNLTTQYANAVASQVQLSSASDGTSSNLITLKRYPGATAALVSTGGQILDFVNSPSAISYWKFYDLAISNGSSAGTYPVGAAGSSNLTFSRVYVYDSGLNGDNNNHCIYLRNTRHSKIRNSYFKECKRSSGNVQNTGAVIWMDEAGSGDGVGHEFRTSTIWYAVSDSTVNGRCARTKHGVTAADTGAAGHPIVQITCLNPGEAILWNSSGLRLQHSRFWCEDSDCGAVAFNDGDAAGTHEDNEVTNNTFYNIKGLYWRLPTYNGIEQVTFSQNCMRDARSSYVAGNWEGIIAIDGYGTDVQKATFENNGYLSTSENCYYNPNTSLVFSYFSINTGASDDEGGNYTYAQWRALTKPDATALNYDATSFNESWSVDSDSLCSSTNCTGLGALNTTSVTTTTTTTTLVTGLPAVFPQ